MEDGRVKIIATGTKEQLEQLVNWCRRDGPPKAKVENVIVDEIPVQVFDGFKVIR